MKKIIYTFHLRHLLAVAILATVAMAASASVNVWLKAPAGTNVYAAGNGSEPLGSWPGTTLSNPNEDGWCQVTIDGCDEVPILIFNKDGNQTRDIINVKGTRYYVYNGYNFFADVSEARGAAAWLLFQPQNADGTVSWFPDNRSRSYYYFTINCPSQDENGNNLVNQLGYITKCPDYDNNGKDVYIWTSTEPIADGTTIQFCLKMNGGSSIFDGEGEPNPDTQPQWWNNVASQTKRSFNPKYYKGGFYEITNLNSGKESDTQYRGNVGPSADFTIKVRHQSTYDFEKVVNHYNNIIMIDDHEALGEDITGLPYTLLRNGVEVATGTLGEDAQVVDTYDESTLNGDRASRVYYELRIDNGNESLLSNTVSFSLRKFDDRFNFQAFGNVNNYGEFLEASNSIEFTLDMVNNDTNASVGSTTYMNRYWWETFKNASVFIDGTPNYRLLATYAGQNNAYQLCSEVTPQNSAYVIDSNTIVDNLINNATDRNHFNYVWVSEYKNEYGDDCSYGNKLRMYAYVNINAEADYGSRMKSEYTWTEGQGIWATPWRYFSVIINIDAQSDDDKTKPYLVRVWSSGKLIDPNNLVTGIDELGDDWEQTWTQGEELGEGKDLRNIVIRDIFAHEDYNFTWRKQYKIRYYAESVPNDNASSKAPHQVLSDDEEEINGELVAWPGHYVAKEVILEVEFNNDIPTGICSVVSEKEIASVKYVNTMGVESDTPFKGINIVVTTYSDGTTSTRKETK